MDTPFGYQIKVQGRLDHHAASWFNGMAIAVERAADGAPVTVLTGTVVDQAALLGLLLKASYFNLPLISVSRLETEQGWAGAGEGHDDPGADDGRPEGRRRVSCGDARIGNVQEEY